MTPSITQRKMQNNSKVPTTFPEKGDRKKIHNNVQLGKEMSFVCNRLL
jgi:hypothetical protein